MTIRTLFPTVLYETLIGDDELRAGLNAACWALEEGDVAGQDWCEREGYDGYTSYASLNDLPTRMPEFAQLAGALLIEANKFARALHWDLEGGVLRLESLWVNMLGEGGSHSGHIHPGSVISGTYYVTVPPGAGALKLEDPRLAMMMAAPALADAPPEESARFVYLKPKEGHAFFWESWLRHEVMPNKSEDIRISISFNFCVEDS